jgi:hypothetical protein
MNKDSETMRIEIKSMDDIEKLKRVFDNTKYFYESHVDFVDGRVYVVIDRFGWI